ncbi:hypothetical protein EVAR_49645_1 [Eumeta japonica]|uniref:Uncharacterized protein n=1 Tax=Eumeta variegata TaxID=151549 RepID=A0A4C1YAM3_EUMVA|nr:hypothetical protein EVAR_49645_1 [Eumeta japonica]
MFLFGHWKCVILSWAGAAPRYFLFREISRALNIYSTPALSVENGIEGPASVRRGADAAGGGGPFAQRPPARRRRRPTRVVISSPLSTRSGSVDILISHSDTIGLESVVFCRAPFFLFASQRPPSCGLRQRHVPGPL